MQKLAIVSLYSKMANYQCCQCDSCQLQEVYTKLVKYKMSQIQQRIPKTLVKLGYAEKEICNNVNEHCQLQRCIQKVVNGEYNR